MKKSLYLMPLIFLSYGYSDTITPGVIGLLIPSTGVVDTSRRWDDKMYRDFEMIAATITSQNSAISAVGTGTQTIVNNFNTYTSTNDAAFLAYQQSANSTMTALSNSSSTLFTNLTSTAVSLSNYITSSNSTMTAISNSTSTLFTNLTSTAVQVSKFIDSANSTMTALSVSTSSLLTALKSTAVADSNFWNSANSTMSALSNSSTTAQANFALFASTVSDKLSNGPISIYDEGVAQGNATTLNFVGANVSASNSGSTTTVTITGSSGGGGGGAPYALIIGTVGMGGIMGVNCVLGNGTSLNVAYSSVGAAGTTWQSTASATIGVIGGPFIVPASTIPAGINFVCLTDSCSFVDTSGTAQQFFKWYGKASGIYFDYAGQAFTSMKVQFSSNSRMTNGGFINGGNQVGSVANNFGVHIGNGNVDQFSVVNNVRLTNVAMLDFNSVPGVNRAGDSAPFNIWGASNVLVSFQPYRSGSSGASNGTNVSVYRATETYIENSDFRNMGGEGIVFADGCRNYGLRNSKMEVTQAGSVAHIHMGNASGTTLQNSTFGVVSDVYITRTISDTPASVRCISRGVSLRNVIVHCRAGGGTAFSAAAGSLNIELLEVESDGCTTGLNDAGTGLIKGYYIKDHVLQ